MVSVAVLCLDEGKQSAWYVGYMLNVSATEDSLSLLALRSLCIHSSALRWHSADVVL